MRQAIQTRYAGPTDSRGSRIIVKADAGRMTVSWDHALDVTENHTAAARKFAEKYGWEGKWVGGSLPGGGYVFVWSTCRLGDSDGFTVEPSANE